MSFTAEEYRTTIAVLEAHSCEDLADGFSEFLERAEDRERSIEALGLELEAVVIPQDATYINGLRAYHRLMGLGWTPPKGLL